MVRINPDPHEHGFMYEPTQAVTAFFSPEQDTKDLVQTLEQSGFEKERIDVFAGEQGADRLDPEGKHHGFWVRIRRAFEGKFDEGHEILHRAEVTLRSGGSVVEVFTHGETAKKERAAEMLKAAGGTDVMYWGRFVAEYM